MAATIDHVVTVSTQASQDSFTFSNTSVGTAAADRIVGLVIEGTSTGPATIDGVTVEGNAASALRAILNDTVTANPVFIAIYAIALPTGTDADIVVDFASNVFDCTVHVHDIKGADIAVVDTAIATAAGGGPTTKDLSLDVPAGGIAFGGCSSYTGGVADSHTWTGATEDNEEHNFGDGNCYSAASHEEAAG